MKRATTKKYSGSSTEGEAALSFSSTTCENSFSRSTASSTEAPSEAAMIARCRAQDEVRDHQEGKGRPKTRVAKDPCGAG